VAVAAAPGSAEPLGPGFTYQGQLKQNGSPVNGTTYLRFTVWDALAGGTQIGSSQTASVAVANGLFTVELNAGNEFGASAFDGGARWLQIEVCSGPGCPSSTLLHPRQPLTATPYSRFSAGPWQTNGTNLSFAGGNVGIGTADPHAPLEVQSGFGTEVLRFGLDPADYHSIVTGFHGALPFLNILGFNLEYNSNDIRRVMTLRGDGYVGIGTEAPGGRLDVRGDVRLGPGGQYYAPAGEENLRIMRGSVGSSGAPEGGCCFSATKCGTGCYHVTFNSAFYGAPTITVTPQNTYGGLTANLGVSHSGGFEVKMSWDGSPIDNSFNFIAVGLRVPPPGGMPQSAR
jgi:hypothetical protein